MCALSSLIRVCAVCVSLFLSLLQLRRGEEEASRRSSRLSKREDTMDKLKDAQRSKIAKDNALNVERKRYVRGAGRVPLEPFLGGIAGVL